MVSQGRRIVAELRSYSTCADELGADGPILTVGDFARVVMLRAMRAALKAGKIHRILDDLYPEPPIPLAHRDPFTLLVAVALSAQTTDRRVNLVTPELFRRAPTAACLAAMEVAEILEIIRTCGLAPAKSRNLQRMAELLVERHGGMVPRTFAELEALPGVGHKTASVVMSQAFAVPAFPVDTHIHRLAARWGLSDGHSVVRTEADLKTLFPRPSWNRLHLQIIYFGREHCPARGHEPAKCPICSWAFVREPKPAKARKRPSAAKKKARSQGSSAATNSTGKRSSKKDPPKTKMTEKSSEKAAKKRAAKKRAAKKRAAKKRAAKKGAAKKGAAKKGAAKKAAGKKKAAKKGAAKKKKSA